MLSCYEYNWYRWLRRELAIELHMRMPRAGRRRRFTDQQERQFYAELSAAPYKRRGAVYKRWRKEHKVGAATLGRIATEQRRLQLAVITQRFLRIPEIKHSGEAC